jgi:DNA-binding FadR family transcriptional regulator
MQPTTNLRGSEQPLWVDLLEVLVERIVGGVYAPGQLIPTESQLGAEYGVSRSVVRESVKVLVEKGLIRIDRGKGTVVAKPQEWRSLDAIVLAARLRGPEREKVLHELFVLRRCVEPELAALAAATATAEDVVQLSMAVNEMSGLVAEPDEYAAADLAFHQSIVHMSGIGLAQELFLAINEPLTVSRTLTNQISGAVENAHKHHLSICDAIRSGNAAAARDAMQSHIDWAEQHLPSPLPAPK